VLVSPLTRALETARLTGFGEVAQVEPDLAEWDYGDYDGRTAAEIREERPGWTPWHGGYPGGETLEDLAARADRIVDRVRNVEGDVALFAHGHILRVITARWLEQPPVEAARYYLATASLSVLGWEQETSVIDRWNEACHLES
jgi:probable phosphoglycerate mutase